MNNIVKDLDKFTFNHPSTSIVCGSSSSGKTTLVLKIIQNRDLLFNKKVKKVLYCYRVYQNAFNTLKEDPNVIFHEGLLSVSELKDNYENSIIILDDFMDLLNQEIAALFTIYSHHYNLSVFFLIQNLFVKNRYTRDVALNTHYIILFAQRRDLTQLNTLARQLFPGKSKDFLSIYKQAVSKKYSYILIDICPNSVHRITLRTNILPDQFEEIYLPDE